jgi:urease accessory protein
MRPTRTATTRMTELAAILQLADGAFPAGGFGHSFGLETAMQDARVHDDATLHAWIVSYLVDGSATTDGAAIVLALRDEVPLGRIDRRLAAARPNPEIRRADRHLARATLDVYRAIGLADGNGSAAAAIDAYAAAIDDERCAGIHALAVACGYRAIGATITTTLEAYAATLVAGFASVAARGVPLGQRVVARVRWTLRAAVATFVARALATEDLDDIRSAAIGCELDGLRHRTLDARLFAS